MKMTKGEFLEKLCAATTPFTFAGGATAGSVPTDKQAEEEARRHGLPVIEAMSCGVPVVTSNNSSLAEVAADSAELVDAESVTSIASGLVRALDTDRQQELIEAGLIRAGQFTWRASAERLTAELRSRT